MNDTRFERDAIDPLAWRSTAELHRTTADLLWDEFINLAESRSSFRDERLMACFHAYQLHAGLALELAAKAVLVKGGITIKDGKIKDRRFTGKPGHDLMQLVPAALDEKVTPAEEAMLLRYTAAVEWTARYPVPLNREAYESATGVLRPRVSDVDRRRLDSLMQRLKAALE